MENTPNQEHDLKHYRFPSISTTIPAIIPSPGSGEDYFIIILMMKNDENKTYVNASHDSC